MQHILDDTGGTGSRLKLAIINFLLLFVIIFLQRMVVRKEKTKALDYFKTNYVPHLIHSHNFKYLFYYFSMCLLNIEEIIA